MTTSTDRISSKVPRDREGEIEIEVVTAPAVVPAGRPAKIHVILRPTEAADWNDEAGPIRVWMNAPDGWPVDSGMPETGGTGASSREVRVLEFFSDGTIRHEKIVNTSH